MNYASVLKFERTISSLIVVIWLFIKNKDISCDLIRMDILSPSSLYRALHPLGSNFAKEFCSSIRGVTTSIFSHTSHALVCHKCAIQPCWYHLTKDTQVLVSESRPACKQTSKKRPSFQETMLLKFIGDMVKHSPQLCVRSKTI